MSIHNEGIPTARLCVIDADRQSRSLYDEIARDQRAELHLFQSPAELRQRLALPDVHVLVIDVDSEPKMSRALQCDLLREVPNTPVIATTDDCQSECAVESLQLGAIDVLQRPWSVELIRESIQLALWQANRDQQLIQKHASVLATLSQLTERQHRVLELAAVGMPNKSIATAIDVSQRTVEAEKSKLLTIFDTPSYPALMVKLGEFRVLEQLLETRQRVADHRLARVAGASPRRNTAMANGSFRSRFAASGD